MPSVNITAHRADKVNFAPEAVFFEATPTGFNASTIVSAPAWYRSEMHEIEYEWDFGDPGATYTVTENTLPQWKDANRGFGQVVAHVFSQPGTYTVTCTARQVVSANPLQTIESTATTTTTVTVADPETVFSPAPAGGNMVPRTVCVALDGDFTGADPTWEQASSEEISNPAGYLEIAKGLLEDLNAADDPADRGLIRILLKRGETYTSNLIHETIERWPDAPAGVVLFGTWGDPVDPAPSCYAATQTIHPNIRDPAHGVPAYIFEGIELKGDYDPITQTTAGQSGTAITIRDTAYCLITGCTLTNHDTGVYHAPWADDRRGIGRSYLVIHDTKMSHLANYGLYQDDRDGGLEPAWTALLGVQDLDVGNAPSGGTGTSLPNTNSQGPVRSTALGVFISDGGELFARNGWSTGGTWDDGAKKTAAQAGFRVPSAFTPDGNSRVFITRTAFEGDALLSNGSPIATPAPYGNVVLDGFLHVCTATGIETVQTQMGGLTMRNGLVIKPAPLAADVPQYRRLVNADLNKNPPGDVLVPGQLDAPIRVYNNTLVILHSEVAPLDVDIVRNSGSLGTFTDVVEANNLIYAPNYPGQPGHLDFAPFDTTELFPVRWLGRMEVADAGVLQTDYAAPPGSVSLYQPQSGSPALASATVEPVALFDLLGTQRVNVAALGALESTFSYTVSIGAGTVDSDSVLSATVFGLSGGESVTYQWLDDGVAIAGATSQTYTVVIGSDGVLDGSQISVEVQVDGGTAFTSGTREVRFPPGSVSERTLADWVVDDNTIDIDFRSDFSTPNLTGTYAISGLPAGVVDDGDGSISGTPTGAPQNTTITVTFTDQYARTVVGSYPISTTYRPQAAAGGALDFNLISDAAMTPSSLVSNWAVRGNTLSFASVTPALPSGLSVDTAGTLSGTPTVEIAETTYTFVMEDEYGRQTTDTFTLEARGSDAPVVDTCSVTGTLIGAGGYPLAGVTLDWDNIAPSLSLYDSCSLVPTTVSTQTDSYGYFLVALVPGKYRVTIRADKRYQVDVTVPDQPTAVLRNLLP